MRGPLCKIPPAATAAASANREPASAASPSNSHQLALPLAKNAATSTTPRKRVLQPRYVPYEGSA